MVENSKAFVGRRQTDQLLLALLMVTNIQGVQIRISESPALRFPSKGKPGVVRDFNTGDERCTVAKGGGFSFSFSYSHLSIPNGRNVFQEV